MTVLETLIYYLQRFYLYLLREEKCKNYSHTPILQASATVPVPVTEPVPVWVPVIEPGTSLGTGDRAWYRFRIALVVPVPEPVGNLVPVGS